MDISGRPKIKLTKTARRAIEIETRKRMRERSGESEFLRKTLTTYNAQVRRALKAGVSEFPYTLAQFREWLKPFIGMHCSCGAKLTLRVVAIDHDYPVSRGGTWALSNLIPRCRPCNFRKGKLYPGEWIELQGLLAGFTAESREDIYRRLTIGGKWSFKS